MERGRKWDGKKTGKDNENDRKVIMKISKGRRGKRVDGEEMEMGESIKHKRRNEIKKNK